MLWWEEKAAADGISVKNTAAIIETIVDRNLEENIVMKQLFVVGGFEL